MQHKLSFQCIDSTLLKLNEHLESAALASDCCAPPDDVEIISGLASFDDGDVHDGQNIWIHSHHSHGAFEDLDDVPAAFDYKYLQTKKFFSPESSSILTHPRSPTSTHSIPARRWHIEGFEETGPSALPYYEGSSSLGESEPWSPLRAFAFSAPEHNDQSSHDFQIDAISKWPSSLQGNNMLNPSMKTARNQRQAPIKHQRMREDQYSAEENTTQRPRVHHPAWHARSHNIQDPSTLEHRGPYAGGQRMMSGSTSSNFSQPATKDLLMENNPAQFFDTRSAYSIHDSTFNQLKRSNTKLRQDPDTEFATDQGLIDESGHGSVSASQNLLTPQDLSWQQYDHGLFENRLSPSTDTEYGSYGFPFPTNDRTWSPEFAQDPSLELAPLDHPGAIKIGGSSGHYNPQLPSSFPPSADCFPEYASLTQVSDRYESAISTSEPNLHQSSSPKLPFQKKNNKTTSNRAPRSGSLSIIREYGHSQHGSPNLSRSGSNKGKRKGPLPTATALAAAQKRKDGNVCIRCRTMKMTVKRR